MIYSDGPDEDMLSAIQETIKKDEFKFLCLEQSVDHIHDIDAGDEETENEEEYLDFENFDESLCDNDRGEPTLAPRSKNTSFRGNKRLSPHSSPLDDEYYHCNKGSFI
ncbi:hypothetical protein BGZ47_011618 [Haplosporangium gracile]|nr:hypothetical protein BGZ47_011618 [Haplosporangium gracile]